MDSSWVKAPGGRPGGPERLGGLGPLGSGSSGVWVLGGLGSPGSGSSGVWVLGPRLRLRPWGRQAGHRSGAAPGSPESVRRQAPPTPRTPRLVGNPGASRLTGIPLSGPFRSCVPCRLHSFLRPRPWKGSFWVRPCEPRVSVCCSVVLPGKARASRELPRLSKRSRR